MTTLSSTYGFKVCASDVKKISSMSNECIPAEQEQAVITTMVIQ